LQQKPVVEALKLKLKYLKMAYNKNNASKNDLKVFCSNYVTNEDYKSRETLVINIDRCRPIVFKERNKWTYSSKYLKSVIAFDFSQKISNEVLKRYTNSKLPFCSSVSLINTKLADENDLNSFIKHGLPSQLYNFKFSYKTKAETCWFKSLKIFTAIVPSVIQEVKICDFAFSTFMISEFISLLVNARVVELIDCDIKHDSQFVFDVNTPYKLEFFSVIFNTTELDVLKKETTSIELFDNFMSAISRCPLKDTMLDFQYVSSVDISDLRPVVAKYKLDNLSL